MFEYLPPLNAAPVMTKEECEAMEKDRRAEADLSMLIEAEKIRRDPDRFNAALTKRAKMQEELERIAPKPKS